MKLCLASFHRDGARVGDGEEWREKSPHVWNGVEVGHRRRLSGWHAQCWIVSKHRFTYSLPSHKISHPPCKTDRAAQELRTDYPGVRDR